MVGFLLHHVYADQTSLILNSPKIFISGNYTLLQFVAKLYIQHSNFLKVQFNALTVFDLADDI